MNETTLHRWIARHAPGGPGRILGPGDDAAVLRTGTERIVLTADSVIEGVHFAAGTPWERVGRKLVARGLSDIAAMGALPLTVLLAAGLPSGFPDGDARKVLRGAFAMARRLAVSVSGGDLATTRGRAWFTITVVGRIPRGSRPLRRSGARPGDRILVTGSFGGSILGRHLRPSPRLAEGRRLARCRGVHAAIDVSDGLSLDLARLCEASGVGAELEGSSIPIAPAARRLARRTGRSALDHALGDGEDYELLVAASSATARRLTARTPPGQARMRVIGGITAGRRLGLRDRPSHPPRPLDPTGWIHR